MDEAAGATVIDVRLAATVVAFNVAHAAYGARLSSDGDCAGIGAVAWRKNLRWQIVESEELHFAVLGTS